MFAFLSAPLDTALLSHAVLAPPLTRSLRGNNIGVEGASALAAILKETMISNLECAATPSVFAFVSAPIDTAALSPSSLLPLLAVFVATASELRACPRSLPSSRRRRS